MSNKFLVCPQLHKYISGVLPNNKRITEPTEVELSRTEYIRCINLATVYAIVGNDKILCESLNYDDAMKLFNLPVPSENAKTINLTDNANQKDKVAVSNGKKNKGKHRSKQQNTYRPPVNNTPEVKVSNEPSDSAKIDKKDEG